MRAMHMHKGAKLLMYVSKQMIVMRRDLKMRKAAEIVAEASVATDVKPEADAE